MMSFHDVLSSDTKISVLMGDPKSDLSMQPLNAVSE